MRSLADFDLDYGIRLIKRSWGWTAWVHRHGIMNIEEGPRFRRRSRDKALARAKRWCEMDQRRFNAIVHGDEEIDYRVSPLG